MRRKKNIRSWQFYSKTEKIKMQKKLIKIMYPTSVRVSHVLTLRTIKGLQSSDSASRKTPLLKGYWPMVCNLGFLITSTLEQPHTPNISHLN